MSVGTKQVYSQLSSTQDNYADIVPVRHHRPDYMIILYMGLLMLLSVVVMYAIGPQRANVLNTTYGSNYDSSYFFIKQISSLAIALFVFTMLATIPLKWVTKYSRKLLLFAFLSCILLAVAGWANLGIAQQSLGATRWFNLGVLGTLQPSEFLKFAILVFMAGFLGNKSRKGKLNDVHETIIPLAVVMAVALLFIVVIQKDLGTGIAMISIVLSMLFIGGMNKRIATIVITSIAVVGLVVIVIAPHRLDRITTYLKGDTSSSDAGSSYQIDQSKLAIGTGGLFGVGIGNSVQATGYLPEAVNDSLFAIMGEIFGFVGLMVILSIFVALLVRLLQIMDHLVDIRYKLLAAGVFGWFGAHVILNIASMLGVFPLTGITLPLLSFGGTSMIFIAAALGVVFQLSGYTVHSSKLKEVSNENFGSRRGIGRSRYAGRGSFTRN